MKTIAHRILLAVLAIGLCSNLLAEEKHEYPRVSLMGQGGGPKPSRDEYVILVVDGDNLVFEKNPVPNTAVVAYVNELLKTRKVSFIALCAREGTRFKDIVRAVDVLRGTNATNIGISMNEVAAGRDP